MTTKLILSSIGTGQICPFYDIRMCEIDIGFIGFISILYPIRRMSSVLLLTKKETNLFRYFAPIPIQFSSVFLTNIFHFLIIYFHQQIPYLFKDGRLFGRHNGRQTIF